MNRSHLLWAQFKKFKLTTNVRARGAGEDWKAHLLQVGNGDANDRDGRVLIDDRHLCDDVVTKVFGETVDPTNTNELSSRAILVTKNIEAHRINNAILERFEGSRDSDSHVYKSIDVVVEDDARIQALYPMEYLNSLTPTGMPPHELRLKVCAASHS